MKNMGLFLCMIYCSVHKIKLLLWGLKNNEMIYPKWPGNLCQQVSNSVRSKIRDFIMMIEHWTQSLKTSSGTLGPAGGFNC